MINAAALVLTVTLLSDFVAGHFDLAVPGAAMGMVGMTLAFILGGRPHGGTEQLFDWVSPPFPMFFVPAAVGLIATGSTLATAWIDAVLAVVIGTTVTIAVTGMAAQALFRVFAKGDLG